MILYKVRIILILWKHWQGGIILNIFNLASFIEIINENSISKAASNLHMTQSALSQQLKSIENDLNCQLVERSNRGVTPTEAGNIVFKYAEIFLDLYENMMKEIEDSKKLELKEIKIGSSNSVCEYLIPCTLYTYRKKDRNIRFTTKCDYTKNVIDSVKSYRTDVGFITMEIDDPDITCTKIEDHELVIIYSPENNEMDKVSSLKDLASEGFIMGPEESGIRKVIEKTFASNGIPFNEVNIHMELGSMEAIKTSVIENHGISIVPYATAKKELFTGTLKSKKIDGLNLKCDICLIYLKNHKYNEHIIEFIDYMEHFGRETFC